MVTALILGSSHAVMDESHRPAQLAVVGETDGLLIDCGVCPRSRLAAMGVGRDGITDVIITHFHPDHVAGLPAFLSELWLSGRQRPLHLHAPDPCLRRIRALLELFAWRQWPKMYPVEFFLIQAGERVKVMSHAEFSVFTSPVRHLVPTVGLRVDLTVGASLVYSSDTEPSDALVRLAQNAEILLHEAAGGLVGHSSAAQAADIARRAGVKRLMLIHYDPSQDPAALVRAAQSVFLGEIHMAVDEMTVPLG